MRLGRALRYGQICPGGGKAVDESVLRRLPARARDKMSRVLGVRGVTRSPSGRGPSSLGLLGQSRSPLPRRGRAHVTYGLMRLFGMFGDVGTVS